jgi:sec-independent protein translocase protein TatA
MKKVFQRPESLTEARNHYCPGCSHGIIHRLLAECMDEMNIREKTIGNFGPWEMVFILAIILIIVGPGKLPKVGESVGKALRNFRQAQEKDDDYLEELADKK